MNQFPSGNNFPESIEQLRSWLPIDAVIHDGRPAIKWMDVADADFNEPFFHETIVRLTSNRTVITELDALLQLEKVADSVEPTGFIMHASRCGSTLLANACKAVDDSLVISEPPVLDKLASRFLTDADSDSSKEMLYMLFLRAAVSLLGQRRKRNEQRYFVKFACTTTLQLEQLRKIWPRVPFIFLYRDPVEIIVSNLKTIPEWMQPESNPATAAAIVGVNVAKLKSISAEEFCARAVGRFFEAAALNQSPQLRTINYSAVCSGWLFDALTHLGVRPNENEADAINKVSRLYSKDVAGRRAFSSDSDWKKASASPYITELAQIWASVPYERLNTSIQEGNTHP